MERKKDRGARVCVGIIMTGGYFSSGQHLHLSTSYVLPTPTTIELRVTRSSREEVEIPSLCRSRGEYPKLRRIFLRTAYLAGILFTSALATWTFVVMFFFFFLFSLYFQRWVSLCFLPTIF